MEHIAIIDFAIYPTAANVPIISLVSVSNGSAAMTYWASVINRRIDRRRAILATGATAAGAAFLAACSGGSGSSNSKDAPKASGLLASIDDESKNAIRGGTYKFIIGTSPL